MGQVGVSRDEVITQAAVSAADDQLDDWIVSFDRALKDIVHGDTQSPLYKRYFTSAPWTFIRMGLESEISRVRGWVDSRASESNQSLKDQGATCDAHHPRRSRPRPPAQSRRRARRSSRLLHHVAHRRDQHHPRRPVRQARHQGLRGRFAPRLAEPLFPQIRAHEERAVRRQRPGQASAGDAEGVSGGDGSFEEIVSFGKQIKSLPAGKMDMDTVGDLIAKLAELKVTSAGTRWGRPRPGVQTVFSVVESPGQVHPTE